MAHKAARCGKTANSGRAGPAFSPSGFTPRFAGLKSIQDFLPAVAKPVFERFGFSSAEILTNWVAYAGPEIASYTAPERLKWPRTTEVGKSGATLILRVGGARAIELQHKLPQLIERVNAAFGYRAVTAIRILQAPLPGKPEPRARLGPPTTQHRQRLAHVVDERLREALALMSAGVEARNSPQSAVTRTGF